MTPELFTLLLPEQQEAWERCAKATPGPHQARFIYRMIRLLREHGLKHGLMPGEDEGHDWADADLWANAGTDLSAALLEFAQVLRKLAELQAAVDAAPHGKRCKKGGWYTKPVPAELGSPQQVAGWLADQSNRVYHPCNCWKSRIPK